MRNPNGLPRMTAVGAYIRHTAIPQSVVHPHRISVILTIPGAVAFSTLRVLSTVTFVCQTTQKNGEEALRLVMTDSSRTF